MSLHLSSWRMAICTCITVVLCLAQGVASAAPQRASITDLGRPTNAVPGYVPLGGFTHRGPFLRSGHQPELRFIGTQPDDYSAAERWPLVKALDQFGKLTGVKPSSGRYCHDVMNKVQCTPPYSSWRDYPTFDLTHARYTSKYLVFAHRDLIDRKLRILQVPSRLDRSLLAHYPGGRSPLSPSTVVQLMVGGFGTTDIFPIISVGGYMQSGVDIAIPGDMTSTPPPTSRVLPSNLSFHSIQTSLRTGKPQDYAPATLILDYNTEANIITALICHADGKKPRSVCSRPAVKSILKHVK